MIPFINVLKEQTISLFLYKMFNGIKNNIGLDFEQGLWFGLLNGLVVQTILLICITLCTNWNKELRAWYICQYV